MLLNEMMLTNGQAQAIQDGLDRLPQIQAVLMKGDGALKVPGGHLVLVLSVSGSLRVHAGEGQFGLHAREWLLLEREAAPTLQSRRRDLALVLVFSAPAWRLLHRNGNSEPLPGRGRMNRAMLAVIAKALQTPSVPGNADFWRREPVLRSLLAQIESLQSSLRELVSRCPGKSRSRRFQVMSRLQRARLYVEGNSNRVVRIGELANLTNFSHWYFTKSFHRVYGMSPKDYGIKVRLTQARELLRDPALTVSEVAAACGFENNSAFARAFRNYYGRPASVLRAAR